MKIGVASDHRGFHMKMQVLLHLEQLGQTPVDCGPDSDASVDYPDFASKVAESVSSGELDSGILICGTGLGMCITANKYANVRAVSCHDTMTTRMSRLHNDANVVCLSADLIGDSNLDEMIEVWVNTEFEGGRHGRRLEKIAEIENGNGLGSKS
ncbi:MAG: ribose 5-phosphate isomerase B [Planctomycetaceae bacterium]